MKIERRVVLISCCGLKAPRPLPAKDLYQSTLFKLSREWAETLKYEWAILSAKLGLVFPEQVIKPYDFTLKSLEPHERKRWSRETAGEIGGRWSPDTTEFIILAGGSYLGVIDYLNRQVNPILTLQAKVSLPLDGLPIGKRLRQLQQLIAAAKPPKPSLFPGTARLNAALDHLGKPPLGQIVKEVIDHSVKEGLKMVNNPRPPFLGKPLMREIDKDIARRRNEALRKAKPEDPIEGPKKRRKGR